MTLIFKSGYNTASINTDGKNFETFYNEIETTIKNFYAKHTDRAPFYVQVERVYDDHREALIISKKLGGDKTGRIMWETWANEPYHKLLNRGYMDYSRYTVNAWYEIVNFIINHFIGSYHDFEALIAEEEEAKIEIQTEGMYEYAQEAYTDIEGYVEDAVCLYQDIERTLEDPDYSNLKDTITQLWERLEDIHNAFGLCLNRCDYLTGCDITFDDFCGTDYFSDIEIPGYMGWELEDLMYNGDPADVLENILDNISRENPGYTNTLSAAIDGTGLYLAA